MIPISLKLKGIYSYQNKEQFIDFQHLCDAGLFGIFGTVGSGKSTILEAISFALYGETERLNKRENRGYNMMNLKSDNLLVDFIFRNGADNNEYRFIVKGRRNSKNFEDVKTFAREAFKKIQNDWKPISADSAEEITGLSYINFRRTIIIPQGQFQEFLQLGDTDRTKMMKELFHLERFDLSGQTKILEEKNNSLLTHLEGQLLQLDDVSKEKITEIESKIEILRSEIEKKNEELKKTEAKEAEFKATKELFEKIELTKNELNEIKKQQPDIETLKQQLKEFQYCQIHFKSQIDKLTTNNKKAEALKTELENAKKKFDNLSSDLQQLEIEFTDLKVKFDTKEELIKEADAYEKVLKIKELKIHIEHLLDRIKKGESTLINCAASITKLEDEQKKVKSKIIQLKKEEIDIAELAIIKAWYNELNILRKGKKELEDQIAENDKKKKEKTDLLKKLLDKASYDGDILNSSEINKYYTTNRTNLEKALDEVNNELKQLKVNQELSKYSENLQEGEACPICGSVHHPKKMKTEDLSALNGELNTKLNNLKKQLEELNGSEKQTGAKLAEIQIIDSQISELRGKNNEVEEQTVKHQKNFVANWKYKEHEIDNLFEKAKKEKTELQSLENQLNETEPLLSKEQKNKEKYQEAINQLENDLAAKRAGYNTLFQQIELQNIEQILVIENDEIKTRIDDCKNEYEQVIKKYQEADKNIKKLMPEKDKLNGMIEAKEKDFESLKTEIANDENNLQKKIIESTYASLDNIVEILKNEYDLDAEEEKIKDFENHLFSVNKQLTDLKQKAENKHFNKDEYKQVLEEVEQIKSTINQQNKEFGSLEKEKKEQESKLIEKEKLAKELETLIIRAENIKTLKNLFKASGFVNYVSSVYLQNLVNTANQRFASLTGQKLRLELTETNDFIIRDYLNEGKTRSVKTLSGGQTFQASLSLALALADNIQSLNKSNNNFFFLDEGFGSLDKESLSIVFQSLKSLRKENRVVGVISHVEELQQEIDSYLKIENNPETGSKILLSWE